MKKYIFTAMEFTKKVERIQRLGEDIIRVDFLDKGDEKKGEYPLAEVRIKED